MRLVAIEPVSESVEKMGAGGLIETTVLVSGELSATQGAVDALQVDWVVSVPVLIEFRVTKAAVGRSGGGVGAADVDFRRERLEVGLVPRPATLAFATPEFTIRSKVRPEPANTAVEARPVAFGVRVKPRAADTMTAVKARGVGAGAGPVALEEPAEFVALVATLDGM